MSQLIKQPTHEKGKILDLVFTTQPGSVSGLKIHNTDSLCKSDHFLCSFEITCRVLYKKATKRKIYNFKKADWASLNLELGRFDWHHIFSDTANIDQAWQAFKDTLFSCIDKHIPKISIKNDFQPPWFDAETFELCRKKNRLHALYKENKSEERYMKFSNCRRDFKYLTKIKMKDNFTDENEPGIINKKF